MNMRKQKKLATGFKHPYKENVSQHHDIVLDTEALAHWIYPKNYPIRDYQRDIVNRALYENTLVVLPTGLGKTLIAAVVMFNYFQWFPRGQVVFMAPTKPLVSQQIQACHSIMGIPLDATAELMGTVPPHEREKLWKSKRVFYCTPQVPDIPS
jgi:Fanconi anemia group M protein